MNAPQSLPDPSDRQALLAWLQANRAKAAGHAPVHSLAELASAQNRRLRNAIVHGQLIDQGQQDTLRRSLWLALDGPPVRDHRVESAVLGGWLTALQAAVTSVAHALDDQRPTHDSGPVPKEIQRATKLYSAAVFPSSYGMVLEEAPPEAQQELRDVGPTESLLDRTMSTILDLADKAESGAGSEDAILATALPLGRRASGHLSTLSGVVADADARVRLTWQSPHSGLRSSTLSSDGAQRCRQTLRAAEFEDREDTFVGTVVGGSKVRGTVEVEIAEHEVITVRADREVTALVRAYADRRVRARVLVTTARSPLGREHHSYLLLDLEQDES
ncbi:hypothetical protein [Streptomyces sp. NBC_01481]|uniref:hypothetical protein n=1 Tax=Streptomyces sp. NBC_01481 TaxID=2975869 RepID=UPI00224D4AA0|nr:hypothetical protein [Streptomyces sp. NBC_01481]MCX4584992.1 hypothetical protein [Streptomyces sp. NBC_01481]